MKKLFLILFVLVMVFTISAFAPFQQDDPVGIDETLVIVLSSVLIPALIQVMKFAAAWFGVVWNEKTVMIICFVLALLVAVIWLKPTLPELPSFTGEPDVIMSGVLAFAGVVLTVISSIFGLATLIYRFVLKAVFDALKIGNEKIKTLAG